MMHKKNYIDKSEKKNKNDSKSKKTQKIIKKKKNLIENLTLKGNTSYTEVSLYMICILLDSQGISYRAQLMSDWMKFGY